MMLWAFFNLGLEALRGTRVGESRRKEGLRLDKWLWFVRLAKTRPQAGEMCRRQRVAVNGQTAKPSRLVAPGDKVEIRQQGRKQVFLVLSCPTRRLGAEPAQACREDVTPSIEKVKFFWSQKAGGVSRPRGAGRPTKKERRQIEKWRESF